MQAAITTKLPHLVWHLAMEHLPPRHLYKLMQTSKEILQIASGHREYWTRVALHLVWRNLLDMQFYFEDDIKMTAEIVRKYDGLKFYALHYLVNMPFSYKEAMHQVEAYVRLTVAMGKKGNWLFMCWDDVFKSKAYNDLMSKAPTASTTDICAMGLDFLSQIHYHPSETGPVLTEQDTLVLKTIPLLPDMKTQCATLVRLDQIWAGPHVVRAAQRFVRSVDDYEALRAMTDFKRGLVVRLRSMCDYPGSGRDTTHTLLLPQSQWRPCTMRILNFLRDMRFWQKGLLGEITPDDVLSNGFKAKLADLRAFIDGTPGLDDETKRALKSDIVATFTIEPNFKPELQQNSLLVFNPADAQQNVVQHNNLLHPEEVERVVQCFHAYEKTQAVLRVLIHDHSSVSAVCFSDDEEE